MRFSYLDFTRFIQHKRTNIITIWSQINENVSMTLQFYLADMEIVHPPFMNNNSKVYKTRPGMGQVLHLPYFIISMSLYDKLGT